MNSKFRGYDIYEDDEVWYFSDTNEKVEVAWINRPCGHCKLYNTPQGHDGCLGTLSNVMNACCGHGIVKDAYVQYMDGNCVHGEEAIRIQKSLK